MNTKANLLKSIIREEVRRQIRLHEAAKTLMPIDPMKLQKVFLELGVQSGAYSEKAPAKRTIDAITKIPDLFNKAMNDDDKAYDLIMSNGAGWFSPEYSDVDDARLETYFEKLDDVMYDIDSAMSDGELEDIPSYWNKLKKLIESVK